MNLADTIALECRIDDMVRASTEALPLHDLTQEEIAEKELHIEGEG